MFAPENEIVATVLLLGTMMCWGSWSSFRVLCHAEAPVFVIFYVGGQFLVGTTLALTLGMVSVENVMFDRETFILGFTHPGDWYRVVAIFMGGFCCANSDFLAACACTRLPFAVVVPIFMVSSEASMINFFIILLNVLMCMNIDLILMHHTGLGSHAGHHLELSHRGERGHQPLPAVWRSSVCVSCYLLHGYLRLTRLSPLFLAAVHWLSALESLHLRPGGRLH